MANEEHLSLIRSGTDAWNKWVNTQHGVTGDFSNANLEGLDLRNGWFYSATFQGANLHKANLRGSDLRECNFRETDLREAICEWIRGYKADLSSAHLDDARLQGADFRRAIFHKATLCRAVLRDTNLRAANLNQADLTSANLTNAILVETILDGAILSNSFVYGASVWQPSLNGAEQANLIITPEDEPAIRVDNLEVAQFIYLLLKHEKLRDVLNSVTQRGVLILGRFGNGGLDLLHSIAEKLREMKYIPIIFDFDRPVNRDYTETVKTLAGLSRFVIVELSGPSVPQELYATVPFFKIPFALILRKGSKPYSMLTDLLVYPWVLPPVEFEDTANLLEMIPSKVIEPAEENAKARQEQLSLLFNR
jgi:hypothetical protein